MTSYDAGLNGLCEQLGTIDSLLNDFVRDLSEYIDDFDFSEERLNQIEERLNLINKLKMKHGKTIETILTVKEEKEARIEKLQNYDLYLEKLHKDVTIAESKVDTLCGQISKIRKAAAGELSEQITSHLAELNFLDVRFEIQMERVEGYSANGYDAPEFMISTNPGEPVKPLGKVASGGELSRIMLAIKTVMAEKDQIETLIFDEIDTGVSGAVASQMGDIMRQVAVFRQVISITHLPQVAIKGEHHYLVYKEDTDVRTETHIRELTTPEHEAEIEKMRSL